MSVNQETHRRTLILEETSEFMGPELWKHHTLSISTMLSIVSCNRSSFDISSLLFNFIHKSRALLKRPNAHIMPAADF